MFVTGHSINSARVMNEITNCCPKTASRHACRNGWFFLKRIETTFVSRRRTCISTSGVGRTLIPKFPDHPIESIGFGRITVIRRVKFSDRGLQSWNTNFPIGQLTRINNLRHNPSVPDSLPQRVRLDRCVGAAWPRHSLLPRDDPRPDLVMENAESASALACWRRSCFCFRIRRC